MKRFIMVLGILCLIAFVIVGISFCRNNTRLQTGPTGESTSPAGTSQTSDGGENDNATIDAGALIDPDDTTEPSVEQTMPEQQTVPQTTPVRPDEPAAPPQTTPVRPDEPAPQPVTPPVTAAPENTNPQTTTPESTSPETNVPETTVPETTVPAIEEDGYNSQIIRP